MKIERIWAMPNKQTFTIKPIRELLIEEIPKGIILEPYGYKRTLFNLMDSVDYKIIDNDINPEYKTKYNLEALEFLKEFKDCSVDCVIYDPPYSPRQVKECYNGFGKQVTAEDTKINYWSNAKNEIARVLKIGGKVICFGWNSNGVGINRGFEMQKILLVPHGSNKNDTICTVEIKKAQQLKFI